jgi:radical SAM superfamily enzyme YgiQ (UPF0313 family)
MRVLLISPNRQTFIHPVPPIGILYLASIARQKGHEVHVVDFMFRRKPLVEIELAIREFEPQVVGISIRNIDTLFSKTLFELPQIQLVVEKIRSLTTAPIVLGGAGFSIFPIELTEVLSADYGIAGEADNAFPILLTALEKNGALSQVPGLVYRINGTLRGNLTERVVDLDRIPIQAIEDIDWQAYGRNRGNFGVFTRKGCPLDCIYCPEAPLYGHTPRLRSPRLVADEIEYIVETTGLRWFDFADTLFNAPREHMMAVCQEIIDRKARMQFEVELNPLGQDKESVKLLKAAGCMGVNLTADSGSTAMLKSLNKGYTREMILNTAALYVKFRIPYTVGFLLGGPGENRSTLDETLALVRQLPGGATTYFGIGIRVFRGTALEKFYKETSGKEGGDLLNLCFYFSAGLDASFMEQLIDAYQKDFRLHLCDLMYEGNQAMALRVADYFNVRPLWRGGRILRIIDFLSGGRKPVFWDAENHRFYTKKGLV